MAVLSTLALRPDAFSVRDLPDVFIAEGEKFVAFGPAASKTLYASCSPSRRYVHPDMRHSSAIPDFTTPYAPHEIYGVVDDLGGGDYTNTYTTTKAHTKDNVEFVLNNYDDADMDSLGGGGYRIRDEWKQKYVNLQRKLVECCQRVLDEYPLGCLEDGGQSLLSPLTDDLSLDLTRTYKSYDESADAVYALKMSARNNLALMNYIIHTQHSWWRKALNAEQLAFIDSLELPRRPKRGGYINLASDWSYLNIPLLMQHEVPFAYVWSEATNALPRFARLDPTVLTGYFWVRQNLNKEPSPSEVPAIANGREDALNFDHLLQDKRARTTGSPVARYDANTTYVVQLHEGWKVLPVKDPETIQRCLDRYEHYEKDPGGGANYVVIEAWSIRGATNESVRSTYEFGPVATQSRHGQRLGERVDLSVDERREMYKMSCAPWGGARYDTLTGELLQAVPLERQTALIELEHLFYPRSPALDHSRPPPSTEQHHGDEASTPYLLTRMSDPTGDGSGRSASSDASSLIRRMGGFAMGVATPPPTTHSSWRTETASDIPFGDSLGRRRSASPQRGVRHPATPVGLVAPDPRRINRDDVALPGSPLWQQRYAILRSALPGLLRSLSPREYPRSDDDFFQVKWLYDFLHNGYLRIPDELDRLRVYLWLETQNVNGPGDLLRLCLLSGIQVEVGYKAMAKMPEAVCDIVGPEPEHLEGEYLSFKDGGLELYDDYRRMVQGLCRREHAPSFVFHGGWVSAIIAKYGKDLLRLRVGGGVDLATRLYKTERGKIVYPYGLREQVVMQKPSAKEINKIMGLVIGKDGHKKHWLFPPPHLLAELWPGYGEWNAEEEAYFLDIVSGLEKGTRTAMSEKRWTKQLEGRRNALQRDHADRREVGLSSSTGRAWVSLFDWAYEVKDATLRLADVGPDFRARRLPLFR
ncbi:hypothetical protein GGG16DRAFT_67505 [Schizophyllum commune]